MNSNLVATSPFLAAVAALSVILVSPVAAGLMVTITGVLSMFILDYGLDRGPRGAMGKVLPFDTFEPAPVELRQAA